MTSVAHLPADPQQPHSGEVGIEIAPIVDAGSADADLADRIDALLRRACKLARALTGAEQSALKLWVGEDPTTARKYFSLSEKYSAFSEFRVDPKGLGLHGMAVPPGEVVRLTEDGVLRHPLFRNFSGFSASHPPMRGWLATSVCGAGGKMYGLLQLSDKSAGRDFDASDEEERPRAGGADRRDARCAARRRKPRRLVRHRPAVFESPFGRSTRSRRGRTRRCRAPRSRRRSFATKPA
jgi:GAF domain